MHIIAAKAVCFKEAAEPAFADYQRQIVANAKRLADGAGRRRLPPGQRRHRQSPDAGRRVLARASPARPPRRRSARPASPSTRTPSRSIRTRRWWRAASASARRRSPRAACAKREMDIIGELIARALKHPDDDRGARHGPEAEVETLCRKFPLYPESAGLTGRRTPIFADPAALARSLPDFEAARRPARRWPPRSRARSRTAACCWPKPAPAPARRSPIWFPPSSAASACSSRPAPRTCRNRSSSRTFPRCATRSACRSPPPT